MSLQLLATIATVIAGVIAVAGVLIAVVRYGTKYGRAWLQRRRRGLSLELIPIHFELFLEKPLPLVTLTVRAVNYLRRPVRLQSVRVRFLHVGSSPSLDEITCPDECEVPPHESREVVCQRKLIESEAAALRKMSETQHYWSGSTMLSARALSGKREVRFEPGVEFTIFGTVDGEGQTAA
jgi:hypothetical protein